MNAAAVVLSSANDSSIAPIIAEFLPNSDYAAETKIAIIRALSKTEKPELSPAIIDRLQNDEDYRVRCEAAEALGQIGNGSVILPLIDAFMDEGYGFEKVDVPPYTILHRVKISAAEALKKIDKALVVPTLITQLTTNTNPKKRIVVIELLGYLQDPSAVPALIDLLRNGDDDFRHAVEKAFISEIYDSAAISAFGPAGVSAMADRLANDDNYKVRAAAARVLGRIGGSSEIPALFDQLLDENRDVQLTAARALSVFLRQKSVKDFTPVTIDDFKLQELKLGKHAGFSSLPALLGLMNENFSEFDNHYNDVGVRRVAECAIERMVILNSKIEIKDASAALEFCDLLNNKDKKIREAASSLKVDKSSAVPALILRLFNEDPRIREDAAEMLSYSNDPRAKLALIDCLKKDTDPNVRFYAVKALSRTNDPIVVPVLIERLSDEDLYVRIASATAFHTIRDARAVPALIDRLTDKSEFVRRAAIFALGFIGDPSAVPALKKFIKTARSYDRDDAEQAMEMIRDAIKEKKSKKESSAPTSFVPQKGNDGLVNIGGVLYTPATAKALNPRTNSVPASLASNTRTGNGWDSMPQSVLFKQQKDLRRRSESRVSFIQKSGLGDITVDVPEKPLTREDALKATAAIDKVRAFLDGTATETPIWGKNITAADILNWQLAVVPAQTRPDEWRGSLQGRQLVQLVTQSVLNASGVDPRVRAVFEQYMVLAERHGNFSDEVTPMMDEYEALMKEEAVARKVPLEVTNSYQALLNLYRTALLAKTQYSAFAWDNGMKDGFPLLFEDSLLERFSGNFLMCFSYDAKERGLPLSDEARWNVYNMFQEANLLRGRAGARKFMREGKIDSASSLYEISLRPQDVGSEDILERWNRDRNEELRQLKLRGVPNVDRVIRALSSSRSEVRLTPAQEKQFRKAMGMQTTAISQQTAAKALSLRSSKSRSEARANQPAFVTLMVNKDLQGLDFRDVEKAIASGKMAIAEVSVDWAANIKATFPDDVYTIFISPLSKEQIIKRIQEKGQTEDVVIFEEMQQRQAERALERPTPPEKQLARAKGAVTEMDRQGKYNKVIVSNVLKDLKRDADRWGGTEGAVVVAQFMAAVDEARTSGKKLILYSGPSATGKSPLWNQVKQKYGDQFSRIVLYTTRRMNTGEQEGVDFHFRSVEDLKNLEIKLNYPGLQGSVEFMAEFWQGAKFNSLRDLSRATLRAIFKERSSVPVWVNNGFSNANSFRRSEELDTFRYTEQDVENCIRWIKGLAAERLIDISTTLEELRELFALSDIAFSGNPHYFKKWDIISETEKLKSEKPDLQGLRVAVEYVARDGDVDDFSSGLSRASLMYLLRNRDLVVSWTESGLNRLDAERASEDIDITHGEADVKGVIQGIEERAAARLVEISNTPAELQELIDLKNELFPNNQEFLKKIASFSLSLKRSEVRLTPTKGEAPRPDTVGRAQEKQFQKAMSDLQPKWWDGMFNENGVPRKVIAVQSLGGIEDLRAVTALIGVLSDEAVSVRLAAIEVLGKINQPAVISALFSVLEDKFIEVKNAAAKSLGAMDGVDDSPGMKALFSSMHDRNPNAQQNAVYILGQIGRPSATLHLFELLTDAEQPDHIKKSAAHALSNLRDVRLGQLQRYFVWIGYDRGIYNALDEASIQFIKTNLNLGREIQAGYLEVPEQSHLEGEDNSVTSEGWPKGGGPFPGWGTDDTYKVVDVPGKLTITIARSELRVYETPVVPQVPMVNTSSLGAKIGTAIGVAANTVSPLLSASPVYASEVAPELFAGTIHYQKTLVVPATFAAKWPMLNKIISRFASASTERMVIDQRQGVPDAASVLPLVTFALYNPKAAVVLALIAEASEVAAFERKLAALSPNGTLPQNFAVRAFANENEFVGAFAGFYNDAAPLGKSVALITDREDSVVTRKIGSRRHLLSVVGAQSPLKQTASTLLAADKLLNESIWSMGYHFVSVDKLGGLEALMAELTSFVAAQAKVLASA